MTRVSAVATEPDVLDTGAAGGLAIRGGALRALGYLSGALLSLISAPLLIRHLGLVDFGRYFTVTSLIALVGGVTDVGLATVALREYSVRTGAARDQFMRVVLGARLILAVTAIAAAALFALVAGYGSELVLGTLVAGLGLVVAVSQATLVVPLASGLRNGLIALMDLGRSVLVVLATAALVLASAGVVPFLAIAGVTGLVLLAVTASLVRGSVPMRPSLQIVEILQLLRETVPIALATILNVLYARFVIIVMSIIASSTAVGYFSASYRVVDVLVGIPAVLVVTLFPILARAARDDQVRLNYALQRTFEVALIAGVGMSLVTALAAEVAMRLLGGEEALPAAPTLVLLAVALVPIFLGMTFQHTLLALRRHRDLVVVNGIAFVAIIVLAFALVPPLGSRGGAAAVVIGEIVVSGLSALALLRVHPRLSLDLRVVPRVVAALGLALLATIAFDLPDSIETAIAAVIYALVLVALGAVPREIRNALRRPQVN